jgi:hypothetical protein
MIWPERWVGDVAGSTGKGPAYNLTGPHARVNINTQRPLQQPRGAPVFADLRRAIMESSVATGDRAALLSRVRGDGQGRSTPSLVDRYTSFIALAANHMALITPFRPALAALLAGQHV